MYKFFGEPLKIITSKATGKPVFRFDTKGEFITDDPEIIKRAMGFFDYIPMKAEVTGEKVEKTFTVPPLTITTKGEEAAQDKQEVKLPDDEIRAKAKEKGIKNWHTKKIEKLIAEMEA
jgi:hypothetical protein